MPQKEWQILMMRITPTALSSAATHRVPIV